MGSRAKGLEKTLRVTAEAVVEAGVREQIEAGAMRLPPAK